MNIFEGGNITFICNNWAKYTKDPYILDLEFNDLQLDLKKSSITTGRRLTPSICQKDKYFTGNSKFIDKSNEKKKKKKKENEESLLVIFQKQVTFFHAFSSWIQTTVKNYLKLKKI